MPVAFDNGFTGRVGPGSGSSSDATTQTKSWTLSGTDCGILVMDRGINSSVTGITYNGVALTDQGQANHTVLWGLGGLSAGTHNLVFTNSGNDNADVVIASFNGVDPTTPFSGFYNVPTFTDNNPRAGGTLSCPTNGLIFGGFSAANSGGSATINSPSTDVDATHDDGNFFIFGGAYRSSDGDITWAMNTSATWEFVAIQINAASGGGGGGAPGGRFFYDHLIGQSHV